MRVPPAATAEASFHLRGRRGASAIAIDRLIGLANAKSKPFRPRKIVKLQPRNKARPGRRISIEE